MNDQQVNEGMWWGRRRSCWWETCFFANCLQKSSPSLQKECSTSLSDRECLCRLLNNGLHLSSTWINDRFHTPTFGVHQELSPRSPVENRAISPIHIPASASPGVHFSL